MSFGRLYERLCGIAGRSEWLRGIQDPPEDLERNLDFLEMEVDGEEVVALAVLGAMVSGTLSALLLLYSLISGLSLVISGISALLPLLIYLLVGWYPSWRSRNERGSGLGGALKLVSYMTISLKMNPNLERAAEFSAKQSRRSLGRSFREELWRVYVNASSSAREALTKFARRWEDQSPELKRSIDLIKSSVSENTEEGRREILDRALKTSFEGVRGRMEDFADDLQLPTIVIYGIGVLLPLVLVAVLPVISSTGLRVGGAELGLIYCVALPATIYLLEKQVLAERPSTFPTPDIPSRDSVRVALSASLPALSLPVILTVLLDLDPMVETMAVLWGLAGGVSLFCYLSSAETYRVRERNLALEEEFCGALTQLGNQLESNRPPEDAFRRTAGFTEGSEASEVLEKTSANLRAGGMDVRSALFDPEVGSLREVHSTPIRNTFRLLTELLDRGTRSAGEAMLHTASHLERLKEVEKKVRRDLREIVSSMKSVAFFFAPLVASVTVQLQRVLSEKTSGLPIFGEGVQISTSTFLGTLGFYIITLTVLLSTYTVEIERGDDGLMKRMEIARGLPVAMTVFTFGLFLGQQMMKFLIG